VGKRIFIAGFNELGKKLFHKLQLLDLQDIVFVDFIEKAYQKDIYWVYPFSYFFSCRRIHDSYCIIVDRNNVDLYFATMQKNNLCMFLDYRFLSDYELADFLPVSIVTRQKMQILENKRLESGKIFVVSHKKVSIPDDGFYQPIQVGTSKEDFFLLRDNRNEHIAEKNSGYCELTAVYWLWKNMKTDYIGICHYRRYFYVDGERIEKEQAELLLRQYDILTARPESPPNCRIGGMKEISLLTHYEQHHYPRDLMLVKMILEKKYPAFLPAFYEVLSDKVCGWYNMLIARWEIFDAYCSWLFDILFELEKNRNMAWEDDYQARVYGFLAERLLHVWIRTNDCRAGTLDVQFVEPLP